MDTEHPPFCCTQDTVGQFQRVVERRCKQDPTLAENFQGKLALAKQILTQRGLRLQGVSVIPERIVSFHDPDARAISRGKLGKPNEFGRTMQLTQDQSGLILDDHNKHGNPNDKTKLIPTIERFVKKFGRFPTAVATDKRYYLTFSDQFCTVWANDAAGFGLRKTAVEAPFA